VRFENSKGFQERNNTTEAQGFGDSKGFQLAKLSDSKGFDKKDFGSFGGPNIDGEKGEMAKKSLDHRSFNNVGQNILNSK